MKLPALKEIIEERKEKAIEDLSTSFAKNRLPLEEYERLVEYINKIESERELIVVEKIVREYAHEYAAEYGDDTSERTGGNYAGKSGGYDDDDEPGYFSQAGSNLSVLSSRTVTGPLKSGSQHLIFLGSQHIKIRKADLSKRRTALSAVTILGDCAISVESGIRVINRVVPLLGGAWIDNKVNKQTEDGGPELVISGAAILGNVSVKLLKER